MSSLQPEIRKSKFSVDSLLTPSPRCNSKETPKQAKVENGDDCDDPERNDRKGTKQPNELQFQEGKQVSSNLEGHSNSQTDGEKSSAKNMLEGSSQLNNNAQIDGASIPAELWKLIAACISESNAQNKQAILNNQPSNQKESHSPGPNGNMDGIAMFIALYSQLVKECAEKNQSDKNNEKIIENLERKTNETPSMFHSIFKQSKMDKEMPHLNALDITGVPSYFKFAPKGFSPNESKDLLSIRTASTNQGENFRYWKESNSSFKASPFNRQEVSPQMLESFHSQQSQESFYNNMPPLSGGWNTALMQRLNLLSASLGQQGLNEMLPPAGIFPKFGNGPFQGFSPSLLFGGMPPPPLLSSMYGALNAGMTPGKPSPMSPSMGPPLPPLQPHCIPTHQPTGCAALECCNGGCNIRVALVERHLWQQFHSLTCEMVITRSGRYFFSANF